MSRIRISVRIIVIMILILSIIIILQHNEMVSKELTSKRCCPNSIIPSIHTFWYPVLSYQAVEAKLSMCIPALGDHITIEFDDFDKPARLYALAIPTSTTTRKNKICHKKQHWHQNFLCFNIIQLIFHHVVWSLFTFA